MVPEQCAIQIYFFGTRLGRYDRTPELKLMRDLKKQVKNLVVMIYKSEKILSELISSHLLPNTSQLGK